MDEKVQGVAVFGGGCFWCTEAFFKSLKGVISVVPGYSGGMTQNPTYQKVLKGDSGHVESVKINFDPKIISYEDFLAVFFYTHDPTTLNKQGHDVGTQYASVIFYTDNAQKDRALSTIKDLNDTKAYANPVVTDVRPLVTFYEAEDYHKNYYDDHKDVAYCEFIIAPKLEEMQKRFKRLLKD